MADIKTWIVSYRLKSEVEKTGAYSTAWVELLPCTTHDQALGMERKLTRDFGALAEWTVIGSTDK